MKGKKFTAAEKHFEKKRQKGMFKWLDGERARDAHGQWLN